jgi:hypothetical protein
MIKYLYIIILLLIVYLIINNYCFENFEASNNFIYFEMPFKNTKILMKSEPKPKKEPKINCCLIEKKYIPDEDNPMGGRFDYVYKKLSNENCDLKLHRLDSNRQLYFEDENWSNDYCSKESNILGSCRSSNHECIDFVNKKFCDKYKMKWTNNTCHDPIEYMWIDKIKFKYPETSDNTFKLFDKTVNW